MISKSYPVVDEEFKLGYRTQSKWSWKIASAFFFGEVGAGLFFFSVFFNFLAGMIVGWVMVTICKPAALFMHLGQPMRFWRALSNLKRAWISRGFLSNVCFTVFAFIHIADQYYHVLPGPVAVLVVVLAMAASFMVMIYLGFVLSHSSALSLWNTGLMPVISLTYGLLGGVTMLIMLGYVPFLSEHPETLQFLKGLEFCLILACGVLILSWLHGSFYGSDAGKKSVLLLLKEDYAKYFFIYVVCIGLIFTGLLVFFGPVSLAVLLAVAIAELIGDIGLKMLAFKAATYEPVLSPSRI